MICLASILHALSVSPDSERALDDSHFVRWQEKSNIARGEGLVAALLNVKLREHLRHSARLKETAKPDITHIVSPCLTWPVLSNAAGGVEWGFSFLSKARRSAVTKKRKPAIPESTLNQTTTPSLDARRRHTHMCFVSSHLG